MGHHSVLCGDLKGKGIKKKNRGGIWKYGADPLCCRVEANATLKRYYTPVNDHLKYIHILLRECHPLPGMRF